MINDPMSNPGYLNADRGEVLWAQARGAKSVSLEACDLGEGPGKLEGAYARLPRYFADADPYTFCTVVQCKSTVSHTLEYVHGKLFSPNISGIKTD
jgi:hypothetical protein